MLETNENFFIIAGVYLRDRSPHILLPRDMIDAILSEMLCCDDEFVNPALALRKRCINEVRLCNEQEVKIIFSAFDPYLGELSGNDKNLLLVYN